MALKTGRLTSNKDLVLELLRGSDVDLAFWSVSSSVKFMPSNNVPEGFQHAEHRLSSGFLEGVDDNLLACSKLSSAAKYCMSITQLQSCPRHVNCF